MEYVQNLTELVRNLGAIAKQLSELRSCVKVKVVVLGPPSLIVLMVSVDVKQHLTKTIIRAV